MKEITNSAVKEILVHTIQEIYKSISESHPQHPDYIIYTEIEELFSEDYVDLPFVERAIDKMF